MYTYVHWRMSIICKYLPNPSVHPHPFECVVLMQRVTLAGELHLKNRNRRQSSYKDSTHTARRGMIPFCTKGSTEASPQETHFLKPYSSHLKKSFNSNCPPLLILTTDLTHTTSHARSPFMHKLQNTLIYR